MNYVEYHRWRIDTPLLHLYSTILGLLNRINITVSIRPLRWSLPNIWGNAAVRTAGVLPKSVHGTVPLVGY